ncbi:MAG: GIY-YIG nuclease family protein [Ignavibacteriaceae bacterium]|nr:GIY-YIG nuclease family protein [Ignavibacteriaceae bacterium]
MKFYTYILQSEISGKLYIGQTHDLEDRLFRHNSNQSLSTKNKGPWKLIFSKEYSSRSEAVLLEKKLKAFKNTTRILRWIELNPG